MASALTFQAWAESLEDSNYYDILRIDPRADDATIQKAFHDLSLRCHPDRFIDEPEEVGQAAATVFKRLVEAYNCLKRPAFRKRYDAELNKGALKFDQHKVEEKPKFEQRTLYMIARDPRAKQFAARADAFLSAGKLEEARIQLISACQNDPSNTELKERLDAVYEALYLEPGL